MYMDIEKEIVINPAQYISHGINNVESHILGSKNKKPIIGA